MKRHRAHSHEETLTLLGSFPCSPQLEAELRAHASACRSARIITRWVRGWSSVPEGPTRDPAALLRPMLSTRDGAVGGVRQQPHPYRRLSGSVGGGVG